MTSPFSVLKHCPRKKKKQLGVNIILTLGLFFTGFSLEGELEEGIVIIVDGPVAKVVLDVRENLEVVLGLAEADHFLEASGEAIDLGEIDYGLLLVQKAWNSRPDVDELLYVDAWVGYPGQGCKPDQLSEILVPVVDLNQGAENIQLVQGHRVNQLEGVLEPGHRGHLEGIEHHHHPIVVVQFLETLGNVHQDLVGLGALLHSLGPDYLVHHPPCQPVCPPV